ncbi:hypothetical protein BG015_007545 [Linnemannia schmuckeri]|uniref:HCP-like protein n=1 Tax=Linnemannia schmuckeri TaxID=64567 RepID=A0A9P5S1U2_9FUNG|nr:hypothetical protein BG015_007545 [Linnemannia schmuckeri]
MSDDLVKETLALLASSISREGVQAIRLASLNKTVDIATHKDTATGQEVVLWSDIIMVFRNALYLQYGTKAIPFLKGPDFKDLDPFRIVAVPGATLEVVVDDDNDDESTTIVSKRVIASRSTVEKSRPAKQKSRGPTPPQSTTRYVVPPTATSPPPIQTTRSTAPQALPQETALENSPQTPYEPTSQGSFFTSLFSKVTAETPTVRHQRGPRIASNAVQGSSTVNSLAVATNSQETLSNTDQHNATLRNPQYGLMEEALANYNHIEVPAEALKALELNNYKNDARNPQCESDTPTNVHPSNNKNHARAPQRYSVDAQEYDDLTKPKRANDTIMWANQDDPEAQVALGNLYRDGSSEFKKDDQAAMNWYLKAAEKEYDMAQYSVGILYYLGKGVQQDYAKAEDWFRKAAAHGGQPVVLYMLGKLYEEGHGAKENPDEAQSWYLLAAEQNYAPAQVALGSLLESGQGGRVPEIDRNYSGAMEWYLKAADQGDAQAHYEIGRMFDEGVGVVQDDLKARQWYTQATARGHAGAEKRLRTLESESQAQVGPVWGTLRELIGRVSDAFY